MVARPGTFPRTRQLWSVHGEAPRAGASDPPLFRIKDDGPGLAMVVSALLRARRCPVMDRGTRTCMRLGMRLRTWPARWWWSPRSVALLDTAPAAPSPGQRAGPARGRPDRAKFAPVQEGRRRAEAARSILIRGSDHEVAEGPCAVGEGSGVACDRQSAAWLLHSDAARSDPLVDGVAVLECCTGSGLLGRVCGSKLQIKRLSRARSLTFARGRFSGQGGERLQVNPPARSRTATQTATLPLARVCRDAAQEPLSRPVDQDLLGGFFLSFLAGSLDELSADEGRSGADQGDKMWCVDHAPAVLG
jgi:hypothetical protein